MLTFLDGYTNAMADDKHVIGINLAQLDLSWRKSVERGAKFWRSCLWIPIERFQLGYLDTQVPENDQTKSAIIA